MRRAEATFFSFGVVDRKYQEQQLQERGDRMLIRQLAVFDWFGYSKEEHYITKVGSNGRGGESDNAPLFRHFAGN